MKVVCDRASLLDAVNLVSGVVAARTPRPQLTCVKLTATKSGKVGHLVLSATDAEISIRLDTAQVDVNQPGEALIPADKLRQIVSAEEGEPTLTIELEGDACTIRGRDAFFKVLGYPPSEFPPIPEFAQVISGSSTFGRAKATFKLPAGMLNAMVLRTVFATARENSRYAINGVLMKREGKKIEFVATDGRRLAHCKGTLPSAEKDAAAVSCIVPTKTLQMLQRLIADGEETVHVAVTDTQVFFSFGADADARAVLSSNVIEGTFPPYEEVIPKDMDRKIVFDRDVLTSAVKRAALLTNEESRGVRLKFQGKSLELSSRAPEMGEAQIQVDVSSYTGDDIEIGFNPVFITDALKVMAESEVIMELKSPSKAGLLKSGSDFTYVVMPVNLT